MAAAISALNAKIRSNPALSYFCSTHFWGPVSNFGIPVAAVLDITRKDPEIISGKMTTALVVYSAVFMRYSMALLIDVGGFTLIIAGCHFVNECAQLAQGYRYINYWNYGGRERSLAEKAKEASTLTAATTVPGPAKN
ncbi:unnamed protein product [Tuber melanosporum]|uniref:Mitochondrial pyruvate carrier n=1 Tax=Tuber melanosporum (strain Mel28) TaxID=656061 RepID=D5GBX8_TUBMM|nr:uncharacterized protein GSTUM_00005635001 [Tuber melanosporum]CAZ81978.1 unnamed protein product [Tuber melanosporum]